MANTIPKEGMNLRMTATEVIANTEKFWNDNVARFNSELNSLVELSDEMEVSRAGNRPNLIKYFSDAASRVDELAANILNKASK